jgi:sulfonate transport system substrate-binding protein
MISRRTFAASALASLTLAACARGGSGTVLRVGSQKGSTKAVMLASGALKGASYTVEWAEFAAAQPLLEALGSGAIDLGIAGDAPFQFAYQSGSPIRAIGAQQVSPRPEGSLAIVVPKTSSARGIEDLRGKQIATTRGSVGHYLVLRALDRAGLQRDAVKLVFLSPSDAAAALSAGSVDAWSTWIPFIALAQAQGARIIVDSKDYVASTSFDVANVAALDAKSAIITEYLSREAAALGWSHTHQDEYAKLLSRETGLPLPIAQVMVAKNLRKYVPIDAALIEEQQTVLETFARAGELGALRPLSKAFVPGLVAGLVSPAG